jgi:hypothetical protein
VIPQAYHFFENSLLNQNQPNTPISTLKKTEQNEQTKNKGEE